MTKEEFLAFNLPYGLKVRLNENGIFNLDEEYPRTHDEILEIVNIIKDKNKFEFEISNQETTFGFIESDEFDVICRPFTDLTKEISQNDYNNGNPFIPYNELIKNSRPNDRELLNLLEIDEDMFELIKTEHFIQLLKWHFAVGLNKDEFIPVTKRFNPYK